MLSKSKTLRVAVACAMLCCCPIVDAQQMVCGPNGCRMVAAPIQAVRTVARRVVAAPTRVVRRGLFGRRYSMATPTVSAGSSGYSQSYGSSGGTQSYGSNGGTAVYQSSGSSGGLGSYGDGPTQSRATAAPVTQEAPAASVPLSKTACPCGDDCQCVDCDCQTQVCTVPAFAPTKRLCVVPPASVSATCRVPASGLSVEAMASL